MPIKGEDVLGWLGVDLEAHEDIDAFKETFEEQWGKRSEISETVGAVNGAFRTALKRFTKAHEIELPEGLDLDKVEKPAKVLDQLSELIGGKYSARIKELEEAASSKAPDKAIKEWERKYAEADKERGELRGAAQEWEKKYQDLSGSIEQERAKMKVDGVYGSAFEGMKWKAGISPFERKGFEDHIRSNYLVAFDDQGKAYITDKDGSRIKDSSRAGEFKTLEQIVREQAKEHKLDDSNPHGGKPVNRVTTTTTPAVPDNGGTRVRPLNPAAAAAAG